MSVSPTAISKQPVACGEIRDLEVPPNDLSLSAEQIIEKISFLENEAELHKLGDLKVLPIEIILKIFSEVSQEDLSYLARVNTVFKNICYDPQLWNSVLNKHTNFQTKERVLIDKIGCG
ncbi:MAG TPA: F-box protein, partial [Rhabdochlamydiaceae bacterium]|nr:F-box protein [Rhabdochlamydiaceae bacterium]